MSTRTDRNQAWDADGNLVRDEVVQVDTTREDNERTIIDRLRAALATNRTYRQRPNAEKTAPVVRDQVDALTRQQNEIIRKALDLLDGTD